MLTDLMLRLRSLFRRDAVEDDLDDELRFHLEQQVKSYINAGLDPEAARRRARLEFGNPDSIREEHRAARGVRAVEDLLRDLRYAARQLKRAPGFTALAVTALALGIGATTTVFKLVNAVFLRPLPFERADELYRLSKVSSSGSAQWLTVHELNRWQSETAAVANVAGFTIMDFNLRGPEPEGLLVAWASQTVLDVLEITPQLGRGFAASDFEPSSDRAVLISNELWTRRYASDPSIIGSQVDLEGPSFLSDSSGRYTIIGVLPARFWLFYSRTDFVVPMRVSPAQLTDPNQRLVETVVARLMTGTPDAVRSHLAAVTRQLERDASPSRAQPSSIEVESIRDWKFGDLRQSFLFMMGTAVLVAAIACANVALVLIARTTYRYREFAVRLAVGAGRGRVIRQLLTESALLSALGGLAGIFLAAGAGRAVGVLIPSQIVNRVPGGLESLTLDDRVIAVAVAATVLTGLVSGVGALLTFRLSQSSQDLRHTAQGLVAANCQPLQAILVVGQTATAVTLLIAAGLLSRSLSQLNSVDLGIQEREGLVVWVNLNQSRYPQDEDRVRFYSTVFERFSTQPEIRHASGVDMPFYLDWQTVRVGTEVNAATEPALWPDALARAVTPTYFDHHGIRLVAGRYFTERDDYRSAPVAIVSQTLAERYWPGVSPIGRQLRTASDSGQPASSTVIGVVKDIRSAPHVQPKPIVYRPFQQTPPPWMYITVEGVATDRLFPAIRRAVWSVDPHQALEGASGGPWTLGEMISDRTERPRLIARVGNTLAAVALLLATIGVYGLLSYSVARRTSEFGVRIALGANAQNVLFMVLRRTMAFTGAGIILGFCAAAFIMRFLEGMLFGVTPLDPATFIAAGLLFLATSLVASLVPARRAMAVNPLVALRSE